MSFAIGQGVFEAGLPQLRGRLASAYRALWVVLAFAAVVALATSIYQFSAAHPAILMLRLIKGVVVIAVCAILLRRRRDDPVAALLSLAFLTWTITSSVDFASADRLPLLLDRVRFLFFALALLLFPDGRWKPCWVRGLACVSITVFLLGVVETLGLLPTQLFLPLAIGCILAAIVVLISRFRTAASEALRQQLKWVALGLVVGISLILTARAGVALSRISAVILPMPILWEALFQLGIVTVALGFLVSLLRFRLFDAEAAISRSAALAGLTIALVATFAGTEATIEWVGQQYLGMGFGNISAAMAAAVAAVLLNPLHNRISEWAEGYFQRDLVCLKMELPEVLRDLAPSASPSQLGKVILPRITEAVHATRSALIVNGRVIAAFGISGRAANHWARVMRDEGSARLIAPEDPIFPARVKLHCPFSGRQAWLALGPRPDGTLYGKDEVSALEVVRPMIRHALSWVMAHAEAASAAGRRLRSLERLLEDLQSRLIALEARAR